MKAILIVAVLALLSFYYVYPIVRAKWVGKELQQRAIAYEQHPQQPALRILVAGDSTGVGTGAQSTGGSIAGRIGSDFPQADITNVSVNGLRLAGLHAKLKSLPESSYDLIVLQIGANDITGRTPDDEVREELSLVLDYAQSHARSTVLLTSGDVGLAPVFHWPLTRFFSARTRAVRAIFIEESGARNSVHYVDLFKDRAHDVLGTDVPRYYSLDRFHPSSDGYGVWYEQIGPVVKAAVTQGSL